MIARAIQHTSDQNQTSGKSEGFETLLSPEEAAAILTVTAGTLSVWRSTSRYRLPYIKIGARVMYRSCDLHKFLEGRLVTPHSPIRQRIKPHQAELIRLIRRKDVPADARATIGCVVEFLREYINSDQAPKNSVNAGINGRFNSIQCK